METFPVLTGISLKQIDARDPLIAKWALNRIADLHIESDKRSEFINAYVADYNCVKNYLCVQGSALSQSMFGVFGKVGRNDPCACGSGKKYKKWREVEGSLLA